MKITTVNGKKTINGVTLKRLTTIMNRYEKLISWYNKKYQNNVPANVNEYWSSLNIWDDLKAKRDALKAA